MNYRILSLLSLFVLFSCLACNNENVANREDRLTRSGGWKLVVYTTDLAEKANAIANDVDLGALGGLSREVFEAFLVDIASEADSSRSCQIDDSYFFISDGRVTVNNGPTSCDPSNPRADAVIPSLSNWVLDGEVLSISSNGVTKNYRVILLQEEALRLGLTEPYYNEELDVSSTIEVTETIEFTIN